MKPKWKRQAKKAALMLLICCMAVGAVDAQVGIEEVPLIAVQPQSNGSAAKLAMMQAAGEPTPSSATTATEIVVGTRADDATAVAADSQTAEVVEAQAIAEQIGRASCRERV